MKKNKSIPNWHQKIKLHPNQGQKETKWEHKLNIYLARF